MDKRQREIIRRLLKGDTLTAVYDSQNSGRTKYYLGYNGNSPLYVDQSFAQCLMYMEFLEAVAYNEVSYKNVEEDYVCTDKLRAHMLNTRHYSLGDTVEYKHVYDGRKKGIITKEGDPFGLNIYLDGVTNVKYIASTAVIGDTRTVLTEKTIMKRNLEYDYWKAEVGAEVSDTEGVQWHSDRIITLE